MALLWTGQHLLTQGISMAEQEPILTDPPTHEVAVHVRDYSRFTKLIKWSAITCLVIAFIVIVFVLK